AAHRPRITPPRAQPVPPSTNPPFASRVVPADADHVVDGESHSNGGLERPWRVAYRDVPNSLQPPPLRPGCVDAFLGEMRSSTTSAILLRVRVTPEFHPPHCLSFPRPTDGIGAPAPGPPK